MVRRGGMAYYIFKAIPKFITISLVFIKSACSVKIEKWWQDHVTGLRRLRIPWYQHEPRQQLALSTTLQNGSLIISLTTCQEPSFFRCFSSWQKTEANNCYLQNLRTKLKSVNIGKWLIIHNQPSSRKSNLKYYHHLASNFFGLNFRQFQATQKYTESVLQGT